MTLFLDACGHERAVRLMKNHFIDNCIATKLD